MVKLIHLLAITAFMSLQVIVSVTDARYQEDDEDESESNYLEEDWYEDEPECPNENEVYDPCFSPCLQKSCDYDPRLVKCAPPPKLGDPGCVAGCRCAKGYVRNGKRCTREKECKKKCKKPNEVYDVCPGTCPRRVCGFDDRRVRCKRQPKPGDPKCKKPACRCKNGYYRDDKGNCVPWKKCPVCRNRNEVYDPCFSPCLQRSCNYDPRLVKCAPPPKLGDPGCIAGCRCANGYVRDGKRCVRQKDCKKKCKKPNEVYEICPAPCPPRVCGIDDRAIRCKSPPKPGDPDCLKPGCKCRNGFYRNDKGDCVTWEQCRGCNGDINAVPGCGVNCGKKCSELGKEGPFACPEICQVDGCDCKDGFYYDNNQNRCVPADQCPSSCKENEVLSSCANGGCRRRKCSDIDGPILCIDPIKCEPGCICADGYYQNANGDCISKEECQREIGCGGDINAVPGCGVNCGKKCSDVGKEGPFACPKICQVDGCDCKDGFYYDNNKKRCVPADQCTSSCKKNEVLSSCANGGCRRRKCSDIDGPILCIDPIECEPGCICADGYYQNDNGDCISKEECQRATSTCKENEVLSSCANGGCRRRKCTDIDGPILCVDPIKCEPGCICADGYYKNANGDCVSKEECQREIGCKGDKNAVPGCGTNCGKKCSDLGKKGPGICPLICILDACDCKKGYYYDENTNRCVLPNECS